MKSRFQREREIQERRYQRVKRKAEKYIRLADAWIKIMNEVIDELEKIDREEAGEE